MYLKCTFDNPTNASVLCSVSAWRGGGGDGGAGWGEWRSGGRTRVLGGGVRGEQLGRDFGEHPLHPQAEPAAGAPDAAGLLLQGHRVWEGTVLARWHRVPLGDTHTHTRG